MNTSDLEQKLRTADEKFLGCFARTVWGNVGPVSDFPQVYWGCKSGPVLYCLKNQWRHGMNLDIRKSHSGVALIELWTDAQCPNRWSGTLLVQRFKELGEPFYGRSNMSHVGYWKRDAFRPLDILSQDELLAAYLGSPIRTYQEQLTNVFAPLQQAALF